MRLDFTNPWLSRSSHSDLVPLPTHSLWASISGPLRSKDAPLLIFITGAGGPSASCVVLQRKLSTFVRCLFYDRAGYDRSTSPTYDPKAGGENGKDIYAQNTAADLAKLLEIIGLNPPYILAGHSYGGIPLRAFLQIQPQNVAGVCLLDTATEVMLALYTRSPPLEFDAITKNVDFEGLTHFRDTCGMTDAEYTYAGEALLRTRAALAREDTHGGAYELAKSLQTEKQILGDKPLHVVRFNIVNDYKIMYEEGVKLGDGSEEERRVSREYIERFGVYHDMLARAQCGLSRDARYVSFGEWGHDAPMRVPDVVVEEVRGLVGRVEGYMKRSRQGEESG